MTFWIWDKHLQKPLYVRPDGSTLNPRRLDAAGRRDDHVRDDEDRDDERGGRDGDDGERREDRAPAFHGPEARDFVLWDIADVSIEGGTHPGDRDEGNEAGGPGVGDVLRLRAGAVPGRPAAEAAPDAGDRGQSAGHPEAGAARLVPDYACAMESGAGERFTLYVMALEDRDAVGLASDRPLTPGATYRFAGPTSSSPDLPYDRLATQIGDGPAPAEAPEPLFASMGEQAYDADVPDSLTRQTGIPDNDPDPANDRDLIRAGDGPDLIRTGDDADTVFGGGGNDTIDAGIDSDSVHGEAGDDLILDPQGADTIRGGIGNDTIDAGRDGIPDEDGDPNPDDDRDLVFGGAGNDRITTGDDDDTIFGGAGDDTIDGGIDEDLIDGGEGADRLEGGQGEDTLIGGAGDDLLLGGGDADDLDGGEGDDTVRGGAGDDAIDGGEGRDTLSGGAGRDRIFGGAGDDLLSGDGGANTLSGGAGSDTLSGGAGPDRLSGGDDDDLFRDLGSGDTVLGGAGGRDNDTLDLRGAAGSGAFVLRNVVTDADGNGQDGEVAFFDAEGAPAGTLSFENIENIVPCFTPGSRIATAHGVRPIDLLRPGDRVLTRDNGAQAIRWAGRRHLARADLLRQPELRPVLIRCGALGDGLPERDMIVSPNHRILATGAAVELYFGETEILVAAKHLCGWPGICRIDPPEITYLHILFERHEVLRSDGAWSESFQPGDLTLGGIGDAQRAEILALFPDLAGPAGRTAYRAARRSLKRHEARLLEPAAAAPKL